MQQVFLRENDDDEPPAGLALPALATGRRSGAADATLRRFLSGAPMDRGQVPCRRDAEVVLLVERQAAQQHCAGLAVACEGVVQPLSEAIFAASPWHRDISSSPYFLRSFLTNCDRLDFESLADCGVRDKGVRDKDMKDIFLLEVLQGLSCDIRSFLFKECTNC